MKTNHVIIMALLIVCSAMFGCKKEETPGSVYGMVSDFSTGEPVANANVQLRPTGETALTGTDGMYEFVDVLPGSYFITVSKAEYTDLIDDFIIEVKEGKNTRRDVQIKKRPAVMEIYDNESHEISELDFGVEWDVTQKPFNIFNGGTQPINFTITKTANWIVDISQSTGTLNMGATCPILVTIDRELLAIGDNITTLVVSAPGGGSKELTVKAKKIGELPTINISEAIEIDSVTYRIRCEVVSDGGQAVTERGICWNTFGAPTLDDESLQHPEGGVGQYNIRMENLDLNARYYVCAYAKNAIGVGYSHVVEFKPGVVGTFPSVSTNEVREVTATGATCVGKVIDDGGIGLIKRGVCWGLNENPDINGSHLADDEATIGMFSIAITNLNPNTTYHVRCYATNDKGTSYGEDLSFVTVEGLPAVTTSEVSNITATSAKGGGRVTDQGASSVTARGVCWSTHHNPTLDDHYANTGSGVGTFTANMTSLTFYTTYYVRAYAVNSQGTSYGSEVSFVTSFPSPTVFTSQVTGISWTSATGGGNVTNDGGAEVTERGICWSTSPNPNINNSHNSSGNGIGSFSVEMTGLTSGTTYYVRAYAKNNAKIGYGEDVVFTTRSFDEPTVTTSMVTDITQTTAICGGNVTADGGLPVTERGICWSTSSNPTISDNHTSSGTGLGAFALQMTSLAPNTTYHVRAYAKNAEKTGYGADMSFTTLMPPPPTGAIAGLFTVNASGDKVYFSQGNLQYIGSAATPYWKFADNQWDRLGNNGQGGYSQNVDRDLFAWGTSGYDHGANCYQPYCDGNYYYDYYAYANPNSNLYDGNGRADWGYNPIANGGNIENQWRTLTSEEWNYLLTTRYTVSGVRFAAACVNNVNGLIVLPDDWDSNIYALSHTNSMSGGYNYNNISLTGWELYFDTHGAVFLPAAGYRSGTTINIGDPASSGFYWSSSARNEIYYAYFIHFGYGTTQPTRNNGLSVRLVRDF